jgi:hypothetical protein
VKGSRANRYSPFFAESDSERIVIHGKKDQAAVPGICQRLVPTAATPLSTVSQKIPDSAPSLKLTRHAISYLPKSNLIPPVDPLV